MKIIARNKKALFEYEIEEKLEAGIVLTGDEVKSLRAGHCNLTGSFAHIHSGELFLVNCHISAYSHAYQKGTKEDRSRKLLVKRGQLERLAGALTRKKETIIPLMLYLNDKGLVKVELGVGKTKKAHVRKEELREKDIRRETERTIRGKVR